MEKRIVHVRDVSELEACAGELGSASTFGVDSESNSMYVYREQVCYLQLVAGDVVYLVDTIELRQLDALRPIFGDPGRTAILHGADYDVVCLGRDFDLRFGRLFDTMLAAQLLGRRSLGLAALCQEYFGVELDKSLTKHDWGQRPLEDRYVRYLIDDVLYLEELAQGLGLELEKADLVEEFRIECDRVAGLSWSEKAFDEDGFWRIKGVRDLNPKAVAVLKALWCGRERIAEAAGLPPFKIAHNEALLAAARNAAASDRTDVGRAFRGSFWRRHRDELEAGVADALAGRIDAPPPPRRERVARNIQAAQDELRGWRRQHADDRGVPPMVVLPNHVLAQLFESPPRDRAALAALPGLGAKRLALYGDEILEILERHLGR
ncbi:MAG: HRDC domain-containing protein [Planctomycetes bacterium]|nr:HRDC domain-containing protein [Planctomycetota bacterium]